MNGLPSASDTDDTQNCMVKIEAAINHALNPSLETNLTYYCAFTRKTYPGVFAFQIQVAIFCWVCHMTKVEFNTVLKR